MFTFPDTLSCPIQDVQPECGGTAVVLREVYLLCPVRLPDPLWLPHPYLGQLPHQEVQPSKPLPFPGVSVVCLGTVRSSQKPLQVVPADGTLALAGSVWCHSWWSCGPSWIGYGPTPRCPCPTGCVWKTSMPASLSSSAAERQRRCQGKEDGWVLGNSQPVCTVLREGSFLEL